MLTWLRRVRRSEIRDERVNWGACWRVLADDAGVRTYGSEVKVNGGCTLRSSGAPYCTSATPRWYQPPALVQLSSSSAFLLSRLYSPAHGRLSYLSSVVPPPSPPAPPSPPPLPPPPSPPPSIPPLPVGLLLGPAQPAGTHSGVLYAGAALSSTSAVLCYTASKQASCRLATGIGYDDAPVQGPPLLVSDVQSTYDGYDGLAAAGLDGTHVVMCRGPRASSAALNAGMCWLIALNGTDGLAAMSEVEINPGKSSSSTNTGLISMSTMSASRAIVCYAAKAGGQQYSGKCRLLVRDAVSSLSAGPALGLPTSMSGSSAGLPSWVSALDDSSALACYRGADSRTTCIVLRVVNGSSLAAGPELVVNAHADNSDGVAVAGLDSSSALVCSSDARTGDRVGVCTRVEVGAGDELSMGPEATLTKMGSWTTADFMNAVALDAQTVALCYETGRAPRGVTRARLCRAGVVLVVSLVNILL